MHAVITIATPQERTSTYEIRLIRVTKLKSCGDSRLRVYLWFEVGVTRRT